MRKGVSCAGLMSYPGGDGSTNTPNPLNHLGFKIDFSQLNMRIKCMGGLRLTTEIYSITIKVGPSNLSQNASFEAVPAIYTKLSYFSDF